MAGKKDCVGTVIERFWKYTNKGLEGECWNWVGATNGRYGSLIADSTRQYAHRISYELFIGKIPADLHCCHRCDKPLCVNPQHLFLGTNSDNRADSVRKKRHQYGEKHYASKLNLSKVLAIRKLILNKTFSQAEIARRFEVGTSVILRLKKGRTWVLAIKEAEEKLMQLGV